MRTQRRGQDIFRAGSVADISFSARPRDLQLAQEAMRHVAKALVLSPHERLGSASFGGEPHRVDEFRRQRPGWKHGRHYV
eukprot:3146074-Rhodomonas_salina.1